MEQVAAFEDWMWGWRISTNHNVVVLPAPDGDNPPDADEPPPAAEPAVCG